MKQITQNLKKELLKIGQTLMEMMLCSDKEKSQETSTQCRLHLRKVGNQKESRNSKELIMEVLDLRQKTQKVRYNQDKFSMKITEFHNSRSHRNQKTTFLISTMFSSKEILILEKEVKPVIQKCMAYRIDLIKTLRSSNLLSQPTNK